MLAQNKTTEIRSRIEPELKEEALKVLADCGINLSDAVRLFLRQVVLTNGLPFEVKAPNATTRAAMEEARDKREARFDNAKTLIESLDDGPARQARRHSAA